MVAAPLIVSSLSWTVMTFVDRVFLRWVSGTAMSAAFSGSVVWFAVLCLPLGICAYGNTFVAQYFGEGRLRRIGPAVWQAVWVAVAFTPMMLAAIPLAPAIFQLASHGSETYQQEVTYLRILSLGSPAMLIAQALACFYSGRGKTRVVMFVDALFAGVNLGLDYVLIFGMGSIPAMGIAGAAWATVAAVWMKALVYALLVLQRRNREEFGTLKGLRVDRPLFARLLYFGGPSGLQMLLDVLGFTVFVLLVGRIGVIQSEATSMAFSISTLAFMPIFGLGLTASILVGQRLGENRDDLAARATWTTFALSIGYMLLISSLYVLTPDVFLMSFFAGDQASAGEKQQVRQLATQLLRFVAAYNLFDAALMIFVSAIKGAGDTRFVLLASLVMATLMSVVSWLCVEVFHVGVLGCWVLITLWVWILGVIFFFRFRQGKWRTMRVTERQDAAGSPPSPSQRDVDFSSVELGNLPPS